jgi:hypothetical protein
MFFVGIVRLRSLFVCLSVWPKSLYLTSALCSHASFHEEKEIADETTRFFSKWPPSEHARVSVLEFEFVLSGQSQLLYLIAELYHRCTLQHQIWIFAHVVIIAVNRILLSQLPLLSLTKQTETNSVALSPRTNYTDWATATCRRNLVSTFVDRGVSRG